MVSITVKVTVPKAKFKDKGWVDAVRGVLVKKTAPTMKRLFRSSTFGWSKHPSFRQHLTGRDYFMSMEVYTEDEKYILVNQGAPRHRIPKTGTVYMRFRRGYRSATTPGRLQSRRAYRSGKYETHFKIDHPGFAPRKFDELVAKEYEPQFKRDIQDALNTTTRK